MMNATKKMNGELEALVRKVIEREHDGLIELADVARVAGISPKTARAKLRQLVKNANVKLPQSEVEGRWVYRSSKAARLLKLIKKQ